MGFPDLQVLVTVASKAACRIMPCTLQLALWMPAANACPLRMCRRVTMSQPCRIGLPGTYLGEAGLHHLRKLSIEGFVLLGWRGRQRSVVRGSTRLSGCHQGLCSSVAAHRLSCLAVLCQLLTCSACRACDTHDGCPFTSSASYMPVWPSVPGAELNTADLRAVRELSLHAQPLLGA